MAVVASSALADRFAAAADRDPLAGLGVPAASELAGLLDRVEAFEDLPGKWQAALLQAEACEDAPPRRCCCGD